MSLEDTILRPATLTALSLILATTACLDPAEPEPFVDGRVAHAIPGLGPTAVAIDGIPTFQLPPLDFTYFVVRASPRTYEFTLPETTLALQVPHDRDISAIMLLDLDGPTLRDYHLDRNAFEQRIAVVNGHSANRDLDVVIEGSGRSFSLTVAPGQAEAFDPPTGAYTASVREEGDVDFFELEPFELVTGDHGFLVVVPGPGPEEPYVRLLF